MRIFGVRIRDIIIAIIICILAALTSYLDDILAPLFDNKNKTAAVPHSDNIKTLSGKARIHDGDTITVAGQRIRLIDIDAPEMGQSCHRNQRTYRCGESSKRALERMIDGAQVHCRVHSYDQYARALATCFRGDLNLNRQLILDGWAVSYHGYHEEELQARTNRKGMWAGTFEYPYDWRKKHPRRN